jgi:palmitoyl-protein thioesterase
MYTLPIVLSVLIVCSQILSIHNEMLKSTFTMTLTTTPTMTLTTTPTTTLTTSKYDLLPVVIMHGILSNRENMFELKTYLEIEFGVRVFVMEIGNGRLNSLNMPLSKQGDTLCGEINMNPYLSNGFNFIGISQGGLLGRYYVEKCEGYPVHNLITLVTPHGGTFNMTFANAINFYGDFAQKHYSFSSYWRDPSKLNLYNNHSLLANLNNEVYSDDSNLNRQRMLQLKNFVMVFSTIDSIVLPPESAIFGTYKNSLLNIIYYNETSSYKSLGLDQLEITGRLHMYRTDCPHDAHASYECFKHLYEMFKTYCG